MRLSTVVILVIAAFRPLYTLDDHVDSGECVTYQIKQELSFPGCENVTVANNLCYGQCFSSWTPYVDGVMVEQRKCTGCVPVEKAHKMVALKCPGLAQYQKLIQVEVALKCSCLDIPCRTTGEAEEWETWE